MKKILYFSYVLLLFMVMSCTKIELIDEDPKGFLNDQTLFDTEAGAQAALVGCYSGISTYYYFGVAYTQFLSLGSGAFWTDHAASLPLARQTSQPTDALINNVWKEAYASINSVNALLANMPKSPIKESVKNQILGEGYFLRAVLYFNNVRIWGDVPLRIEVANSNNLNMARTPKAQVYEQIIADLEAAKNFTACASRTSEGKTT